MSKSSLAINSVERLTIKRLSLPEPSKLNVPSSSLAIRSELKWTMKNINLPSATLWSFQPYQDRSICVHHLTNTQLGAQITIKSAHVLESCSTDLKMPGGPKRSLDLLSAPQKASPDKKIPEAAANVSPQYVGSMASLPSAPMSMLRMKAPIKSTLQPISRLLMARLPNG